MTDEKRGTGWIQTYTGRRFYPLDPRPEEVFVEDIAHSLARLCRFTGHVRAGHYSVAQHSVLVSRNVPERYALEALLHDAAEAYLGDVARPWKGHLYVHDGNGVRPLREAEDWLDDAIFRRFGVESTAESRAAVKAADVLLLVTEARDLMAPLCPGWQHVPENGYRALPEAIRPASAEVAEEMFLSRFLELTRSWPWAMKPTPTDGGKDGQ